MQGKKISFTIHNFKFKYVNFKFKYVARDSKINKNFYFLSEIFAN